MISGTWLRKELLTELMKGDGGDDENWCFAIRSLGQLAAAYTNILDLGFLHWYLAEHIFLSSSLYFSERKQKHFNPCLLLTQSFGFLLIRQTAIISSKK